MPWNSLAWLLHYHFDHTPRSQIPLSGLHYRGSCLQPCRLDWPHSHGCLMDGSLRWILSVLTSEAVSVLCLAAPDGSLWMYSGADGLIAMLGANDGHCYKPVALPTVFQPWKTASHSESSTCSRVIIAPCHTPGTSGSSLLLPFLIHLGSEFLDVYL